MAKPIHVRRTIHENKVFNSLKKERIAVPFFLSFQLAEIYHLIALFEWESEGWILGEDLLGGGGEGFADVPHRISVLCHVH